MFDFTFLRFGDTFFHNLGSSELDFAAVCGVRVDQDHLGKGDFPFPGGHVWLAFSIKFEVTGGRDYFSLKKRRRVWSGYSPDLFLHMLSFSLGEVNVFDSTNVDVISEAGVGLIFSKKRPSCLSRDNQRTGRDCA